MLSFEGGIIEHKVQIFLLSIGINTFKEHFILKNSEPVADWNEMYKVYDKKCDHANVNPFTICNMGLKLYSISITFFY